MVRQAHGPEQSRRTHHLTTLSQVEGQITITEIQNSKQLVFDLILDLDIVIWNLFVIWCLYFVISGLSGLGIYSSNFCINCPAGATFPERSLGKSSVTKSLYRLRIFAPVFLNPHKKL